MCLHLRRRRAALRRFPPRVLRAARSRMLRRRVWVVAGILLWRGPLKSHSFRSRARAVCRCTRARQRSRERAVWPCTFWGWYREGTRAPIERSEADRLTLSRAGRRASPRTTRVSMQEHEHEGRVSKHSLGSRPRVRQHGAGFEHARGAGRWDDSTQ